MVDEPQTRALYDEQSRSDSLQGALLGPVFLSSSRRRALRSRTRSGSAEARHARSRSRSSTGRPYRGGAGRTERSRQADAILRVGSNRPRPVRARDADGAGRRRFRSRHRNHARKDTMKTREVRNAIPPEPPLRVLIFGAGVLGSLYGARLAEAGNDVAVLGGGGSGNCGRGEWFSKTCAPVRERRRPSVSSASSRPTTRTTSSSFSSGKRSSRPCSRRSPPAVQLRTCW